MLTEAIINGNHDYDIPQETLDNEVSKLVAKITSKPGFNPLLKFDPDVHLICTDEVLSKMEILKLSDLKISKTHTTPLSDIAGTHPFPMFTEEAIDMFKYELFHDQELIKEYGRLIKSAKDKTRLDFQMGGYAEKTPFIYAAVTHPKSIEIMEKICGIKLEITQIYSIGHVNVSLSENGETDQNEPPEYYEKLKKLQSKNLDNIPSSLDWHYDSVPFVCVVMLDAPEDMIGGETGVMKGDGSIYRVPDPKVGFGCVLQGRVVKHIATKPLNKSNRISFVISYVPADIELPDTSCITSWKPSALPRTINDKLYPTWLNYRFERIEKLLKNRRQKLMEAYYAKEKFDQSENVEFCQKVEKYLNDSYNEFEVINDDVYPPKLFSLGYDEL